MQKATTLMTHSYIPIVTQLTFLRPHTNFTNNQSELVLLTSAMEMIPSPRGPSPSSIFAPKSLSFSCTYGVGVRGNREPAEITTPFRRGTAEGHWVTLRSAKGMVTVRTDGGRSMARQRTRRAAAEAARYEVVLLLLPGAADAQLCCDRTALPISYRVVSRLLVMVGACGVVFWRHRRRRWRLGERMVRHYLHVQWRGASIACDAAEA